MIPGCPLDIAGCPSREDRRHRHLHRHVHTRRAVVSSTDSNKASAGKEGRDDLVNCRRLETQRLEEPETKKHRTNSEHQQCYYCFLWFFFFFFKRRRLEKGKSRGEAQGNMGTGQGPGLRGSAPGGTVQTLLCGEDGGWGVGSGTGAREGHGY